MSANQEEHSDSKARDFRLANWVVRPMRGCIESEGETVRLKPKAMAVLECLARAEGQVVTRAELFDAVWPGAEVSDAVLSQCVVELRQAFGDSAREARFIETIPRVGFRLVPPVEPPEAAEQVKADGEEAPDERVAKPGAIASIVFIAVFFILLLWFGGNGEENSQSKELTLAVLPFLDLSTAQDQGHFADGLTEEVISQLAQIEGLAVTGRASSFQFKGSNPGLDEVGQVLGVNYVVEGSIRKSADALRITAQLSEVEGGFQLWSETYDRPLSDFISIQQEIAHAVGTALKIKLAVAPRGSPHATTSLEAYEWVMRASEYRPGMKHVGLEKRKEYLVRATEIDPEYAYAWAYLAQLYNVGNEKLSWNWRQQSEQWLQKALELEPDSPWVLEFAAFVYVAMQRWEDAERAINRLEELRNTNVGAARLELLVKTGRAGEALELGERAIRRDPLSRHFQTYLQHAYALNGRVDDALRMSETFYREDPGMTPAIEGMVTAFSHQDPERVQPWIDRQDERSPDAFMNRTLAGMLPDREAALDWLRHADISSPHDLYAGPAWAAWLGDPELSLELLSKAPDLWVFWMPHNAEVRKLPGFAVMVEELGLVEYWRRHGWGDFCRPSGADGFECR